MPKIEYELRKHLSLRDIRFITQTLAGDSESEVCSLIQLLTDSTTVDRILDQPGLIETVLNDPTAIQLSPRLYFYLMTRHALKGSGLDYPELADYISGVLTSFLKSQFKPHSFGQVFYVVDWLNQLENSPEGKRYELYIMAGNHLLFLTGIFPQLVNKRCQRRGAPNMQFYESIAGRSFRSAAEHPFSRRTESETLFNQIADSFPELRCALNDLSSRLITMDSIN
ncbi:MAG TPA: hypothetical protein DCX06_03360 [Opitutae bacterium]|nr:hypothetical protein [Opitutae bacterium]